METPNTQQEALRYAGIGLHVIPLHEPLFEAIDSHGQAMSCTCEEWQRYGRKDGQADPGYQCPHPGKHPRISDWEQKASRDPKQIQKWWRRWPSANVGIATGPSGLVAVDKDTYHEVAGNGELSLADARTLTSLTGGGGEHLIYRHPDDGPRINNSDSALPEWVNIRAWGGQIVAPPSLHFSGRRYEWEQGYSPLDIEPAALPGPLRELLQHTNSRPAPAVAGKIQEGQRNSTLTSLAGTMRRRGSSENAILAALLVTNEEQCNPPLDRKEIESIARSVARYEPARTVTQVPPVEPDEPPDSETRVVIHWAQEALEPPPPIEWVIRELISAGSVSLLVGDSGTYKTYAMLDAAVCVALGMPWLGKNTVQGTVLYIDEEIGNVRLQRRLWEVQKGHLVEVHLPLAWISMAGFNLRDTDDVHLLHRLILETDARLVVIDALRDIMPGGDENSVKDVLPVLLALRRIADKTGAAIILIHHTNKMGKYSGSTVIRGGNAMLITCKQDNRLITFEIDKAWDVELGKFGAEIHFDQDQTWLESADPATSPRELGRARTYVLRFLKENGPTPLQDIIGAADVCSSRSARDAVYSLASMGLIYRTNPDERGRGAVAVYNRTAKGREIDV